MPAMRAHEGDSPAGRPGGEVSARQQLQRTLGAGGDGVLGRVEQVQRHGCAALGEHRVAPVVAARAAREAVPCTGRGRRRRSSRCAASRRSRRGSAAPFACSSAGPRQAAAGRGARATSWENVSRALRTRRTVPSGWWQAPRPSTRPARRRTSSSAAAGAGRPGVATEHARRPRPVSAARSGTARTGRRSARRDR